MEPLFGQFFAFIVMVIGGGVLGFIFDFFRVSRVVFRFKRWAINLSDGLFWLLATIIIFGFLLYSNRGEIRLYVFIGLVLGFYFYSRGLSSFIRLLYRRGFSLGFKIKDKIKFLSRLIRERSG